MPECSAFVPLYLIDYAARLLRPVSIILKVGEKGHRVIEDVYREKAAHNDPRDGVFVPSDAPDRIV
ncbi:hypothetical protein AB9E14_35585 [Rhizobium leguminosarum]|uniref:hypothetical protein n=1 Tax=Rhizobium leguminosarum TaxID=384 RepID=UPI001FDF1D2A|nr:hypothetical protein [Rhizobium leguminosarum]